MSDQSRSCAAVPGCVHPFPLQRFKVTVVAVWLEYHFVTARSREEALEKVKSDDLDCAYGTLEHQFPTVAEPTTEYTPNIEDVLAGRADV